MKNLKKIIRIAMANGWVQKDPFFGIKFTEQETHVEFLTKEELATLINKEFKISQHNQVRDIFVFCCYTGLAFADVKTLKPEHIKEDNEGQLWIRKPRQKTGVMCNIPLIPQAVMLLVGVFTLARDFGSCQSCLHQPRSSGSEAKDSMAPFLFLLLL